MRRFVFVMGPTASGKSAFALDLAEKQKGVIFNCDSVQLYQRVDIGSAKPTLLERKRVPHFLLDVVPPPREITAGQYRDLFLKEMQNVPVETPIFVVGGTGFYFLALEKGMFDIAPTPEDLKAEVQKQLAEEGGAMRLLAEVRSHDPHYAEKLHLHDLYRIGRAVEILRSNPGRKLTDLLEEKKAGSGLEGRIEKWGLQWEKPELEKRILQRTQKMLEEGLIEETSQLMSEGLEDWAPLKSVGYKETVAFLKGQLRRDQLEEQILISTRQLAKKQRTWFQRDPEIQWTSPLLPSY